MRATWKPSGVRTARLKSRIGGKSRLAHGSFLIGATTEENAVWLIHRHFGG